MGASPWRHTPSEGGGVAFVDALNSDALELAFGTGIAVEDWGDVKEQKRRFLKRSDWMEIATSNYIQRIGK